MSFERKAPSVWFAAAILAAATGGCALEGAEPGGESTSSSSAQVQAVGAVPVAPVTALAPAAFARARPVVAGPITLVPLESPSTQGLGAEGDDDPRPHPWDPPPTSNAQPGTQGADPGTGGTGSSK